MKKKKNNLIIYEISLLTIKGAFKESSIFLVIASFHRLDLRTNIFSKSFDFVISLHVSCHTDSSNNETVAQVSNQRCTNLTQWPLVSEWAYRVSEWNVTVPNLMIQRPIASVNNAIWPDASLLSFGGSPRNTS